MLDVCSVYCLCSLCHELCKKIVLVFTSLWSNMIILMLIMG